MVYGRTLRRFPLAPLELLQVSWEDRRRTLSTRKSVGHVHPQWAFSPFTVEQHRDSPSKPVPRLAGIAVGPRDAVVFFDLFLPAIA